MPGPVSISRQPNGDAVMTIRDTGQQTNLGPVSDDEADRAAAQAAKAADAA